MSKQQYDAFINKTNKQWLDFERNRVDTAKRLGLNPNQV